MQTIKYSVVICLLVLAFQFICPRCSANVDSPTWDEEWSDEWDELDDLYTGATDLGEPTDILQSHGPHRLDVFIDDRSDDDPTNNRLFYDIDWFCFDLHPGEIYEFSSTGGHTNAQLFRLEFTALREIAGAGHTKYGDFRIFYRASQEEKVYLGVGPKYDPYDTSISWEYGGKHISHSYTLVYMRRPFAPSPTPTPTVPRGYSFQDLVVNGPRASGTLTEYKDTRWYRFVTPDSENYKDLFRVLFDYSGEAPGYIPFDIYGPNDVQRYATQGGSWIYAPAEVEDPYTYLLETGQTYYICLFMGVGWYTGDYSVGIEAPGIPRPTATPTPSFTLTPTPTFTPIWTPTFTPTWTPTPRPVSGLTPSHVFTLESMDEFTEHPGGFGDAPAGDVRIGSIPEDPDGLSDGHGALITVCNGQVELLMFPALDVGDNAVLIRAFVRSTSRGAEIALAGLDGSMDGSIGTNVCADSGVYGNEYHRMVLLYDPHGTTVSPIIQVASVPDRQPTSTLFVTVYVDNVEVFLISNDASVPGYLFVGSDVYLADENRSTIGILMAGMGLAVSGSTEAPRHKAGTRETLSLYAEIHRKR